MSRNAPYPYAQLAAVWHSFYLKGGKPLKSLRLFRTGPWSGYKLKPQIQPSILWNNSNIIPEEFQILPATCEPLSFVSSQNPYLDRCAFLQLLDHLFPKHTLIKGNNGNKVFIMQPYLVSCQNVFWCELSNFYFCSEKHFRTDYTYTRVRTSGFFALGTISSHMNWEQFDSDVNSHWHLQEC